MPTYFKPDWVHISPGSRGPGGSAIPLLITGGIVVGAVKLATSRTVERVAGDVAIGIMCVAGVAVVGCVALVVALIWRRSHPEKLAPWNRGEQVRVAVEPAVRPAVAPVRSPAVEAPVRRAAISGRRVVAGEVIASDANERIEA